MKNTFKPGEKVRLKGNDTIMNVLKYADINGTTSNYCVECWWKDEKWGYLTAMFHQNMLIKCSNHKASESLAEQMPEIKSNELQHRKIAS